jgi:ribosomal protein S18 acetylase RimI-like enzyme
MLADDLEPAARVSAAAFGRDLDRDSDGARRWRERIAYPWRTDPGGAFVAELHGRVIGVAQAIVRERVWCLSMLAVDPGLQSAGAGRMLLERAAAYRSAADAGLIVSSNDPRALALYARGRVAFALHPTFEARGEVDRRALPRLDGSVRDDDGDDLEALAALTRTVRGAPYTEELRFVLGQGARLLRAGERGFVVVSPQGEPWLLVARDESTACALLWGALALSDGPVRVRWITGAQQWAIELAARAGLRPHAYGAPCVRGTPGSLRPFLPSSSFA